MADIIDERIMPFLHELEEEQRNVVETLIRVKTQITELHKAGILTNRAVLGVGGKFSAGKSCFINSFTKAGLPEGQRATTSIATYIVKADRAENQAITANDCSVILDDAAVKALTHEFSKEYEGIGFVRIIDNLIIRSPSFRYSNIAILDTPGYSKSDAGKNADATDAEIALQQLRSVDALVWLMDIENGVINDSDLKFIESLKSKAKILFVFNKADLRTPEARQQIVEKTKEMLHSTKFAERTYAVIAYDSVQGETLVGGDALKLFLDEIGSLSENKKSITAEVREAHSCAMRDINKHIDWLDDRVEQCEKVLGEANLPDRITSVIKEMASCRETIWRLTNARESLGRAFHDLTDVVDCVLAEHGVKKSMEVHVRIPSSWKSGNLWAWNTASGQRAFSQWPGKTMTQKTRGWYTEEVPDWVNAIVISANRDAVRKTADIIINLADVWITVYDDFSYDIHYSENGG